MEKETNLLLKDIDNKLAFLIEYIVATNGLKDENISSQFRKLMRNKYTPRPLDKITPLFTDDE